MRLGRRKLALLRDRGVATVVIDRRIDGWDVDTVRGDSIGGAHALVRHMIDLGHSHIAILTGPADASTSQDRVAGYEAALMHAGLRVDPGLIRYGEFRDTSGRQMMLTLLAERPEVTAVFRGQQRDRRWGSMEALGERGFRIPQDMALVCFDELSPAAQRLPVPDRGRAARI